MADPGMPSSKLSDQKSTAPHSPDTETHSAKKRYPLAQATATVGATTLLSRVLGLLRDTIIAATFGVTPATDAFVVAFRIPNLLRRIVAEGSLANAFVPILAEETAHSKAQGRDAFSAVSTGVCILSLFLSAVLFFFAAPIVTLLSPGFVSRGDERFQLAVTLLQVMSPFLFLISVTALYSSALNVLGRFALPSLPSVILNVCFLIALVFFVHFFTPPILSLAWAVVVGGVLGLLLLTVQLARESFLWSWKNPFRSKPVRSLSALFFPSLLSSSLHQVMTLITTLLASTLAAGSISCLYYAERIFQFPLGVFTAALGTAALPRLSRLSGDPAALAKETQAMLSWVLFLTVPASVGLFALAHPVIAAIYERGSFSGTAQTAEALQAFVLGLCPLSVVAIVSRAFFAQKNARVPAQIALWGIALHLVLAVILVGPAHTLPESHFGQGVAWLQEKATLLPLGSLGLALSSSLTALFSAALSLLSLHRAEIHLETSTLLSSLTKVAVASAGMYLSLALLAGLSLSPMLHVTVGVSLGGGLYLLASLLLGLEPAREAVRAVKHLSTRETTVE